MNLERTERILQTIDRLGAVSVKQLHQILKLGTYRHTCRVISHLDTYLHVSRTQQKIVYLNKAGRELIGSNREIKKSMLFDHMLLCNEAYIYYNCPLDWKREYMIETAQKPEYGFSIQLKGISVAKKKIIPDAIFIRDGYVHLVEIDNTRAMIDNRKKIERYKEMWDDIRQHFNAQPKLCVFTKSEKRKRDFRSWCGKLVCDVEVLGS
jgi:hypothetical protein